MVKIITDIDPLDIAYDKGRNSNITYLSSIILTTRIKVHFPLYLSALPDPREEGNKASQFL